MSFARRFLSLSTLALLALAIPPPALAQQPAAPLTLDAQLMHDAEQLLNEGKYAEAAAGYEQLVKKYPASGFVTEANFRGGYASYLAGNYDAALAKFNKVVGAKNAPPEMAELSLSLTPQVLVAKAAKLTATDPARDAALNDAVRQFDAYLLKYPNSDEAESASFGKALALYQTGKYDETAAVLRANLQKFAQSPTIEESQYLLALTLGTIANVTMQNAPGADKTADSRYDEAERFLRDIITKRQNIALVNDAQFQIGELLLARAGFLTEPSQKDAQTTLYGKALEAYRSVLPKDSVLQAQKNRIAQFVELRNKAGVARDTALFQRYKRLVDKEQEKLAQIGTRGDQTITAKFKSGQIFFQQNKMDETRVLFSFLDEAGMLEDPELKKQALYFVTMTYAAQAVVAKAEEKYNAFQSSYKGDPIAQNLQLVVGAMFLNPKAKPQDPAKAIQYFQDGITLYPQGKSLGSLVLAEAQAMIQLKQFDAASKMLKDTLAKNPPKSLAIDAEFYLATIAAQTGQSAEAIKAFKSVRDQYSGTSQAEQAAFQVGQIELGTEPKSAVGELQAFLSKFPESKLAPNALFTLGLAQAASNQKDAAVTTFKDLAARFPTSEAAPFSFFERAKILAAGQHYDECLKMMRDFIAQYPKDAALYQAFDFMAQIQSSQNKNPEAIATYEEFIAQHPNETSTPEALLKVSNLWKTYADSQGPYLAIDPPKRVEWKKGIEKSTASAERVLVEFPESQSVALALNALLETQRLQQSVQLKTAADIENYFQNLAAKFTDKPGTRSKILFTLAAFTFERDKAKSVKQMASAYSPDLKFAPEDLDLYGEALIESKQYDEAIKVYEKLAADYPAPLSGSTPRSIGEAQAIALAGLGRALQEKGDSESKTLAAKKFDQLEQLYPWSAKMLEVNYGIAVDLHDRKQDEDAAKRLLEVVKALKASAELRAKSMLLLGKISESAEKYANAIDNYIKISVFYPGVPKVAAEGLWRGAQLLERQARGEIAMPTPTPRPIAKPASKTPGSRPASSPKPGAVKSLKS